MYNENYSKVQNLLNQYNIADDLNKYSNNIIDELAWVINNSKDIQLEDILFKYTHLDNDDHLGTIIHYCGLCCKNIFHDYKKAEKFYMVGTKKGNMYSMNNLAIIHENNQQYDLAEKYFSMAIEKGYLPANNSLARIYLTQNKPELAEKCYTMDIERGNIDSLSSLADMYYRLNKLELAEKYYIMAIEKEHSASIDKLANLYNNVLKLYYKLKYINSNIAKKKINNIEKSYVFLCFTNKKRFLSKKDNCPICLEEYVDVIPKECVHYYCYNCYVQVEKCQICAGIL